MPLSDLFRRKSKQIPVIILHGKISTADDAINIQNKRAVIDAAFACAQKCAQKTVFLSINSPGGLPGQSQMVYDYIRQLADKKKISVVAFIEDFGASGGYWLAMAGDKIYCLDTSLVGSIGVVSGGFGLQNFLEAHKIERRLMTAGEAKVRDDMFSAMSKADVDYKRKLLEQMHEVFKAKVSHRRPKIDKGVFDARVAIGEQAIKLGLVDGIANMFEYAEKNFPGYKCRYYTERRRFGSGLMRRFFTNSLTDLGEETTPQLRMR